MLPYFGSKPPASSPEKKLAADEKLVYYKDYMELANRLQQAKDRIQELETTLGTKEQLHDALHQKIQEQQTQFTQEEDTLATEIASLKVDLLKQEAHYENLRKKTLELQAQQEAQLALQQEYRNLQAKMDTKEREYEMLINKITELESAKQQAEERLMQEKNEHKETKSALETEKKARQPTEPKVTLPTVANNSTTLFNNRPQKPIYTKSIFSEPWDLYANF